MVDGTSWPPRVGEAIGRQRAQDALRLAADDIRRVCGEVARRVARLAPGGRVATVAFSSADLAGHARQPLTAGCTVALVGYVDRAGRLAVIPVDLGWGGAVYPRSALPVDAPESPDHCTVTWLSHRQTTSRCSDGSGIQPR